MNADVMAKESIEGLELEKMDEAQLEREVACLRSRMQDKDHVHCTCNRCWQRNNLAIVKHIIRELGLYGESGRPGVPGPVLLQKVADTLMGEGFWVRQGQTSEERARQQALKQRCKRARRLLEVKLTRAIKGSLDSIECDLPNGTRLEATSGGGIVNVRVAGVVSRGKLIETKCVGSQESEMPF